MPYLWFIYKMIWWGSQSFIMSFSTQLPLFFPHFNFQLLFFQKLSFSSQVQDLSSHTFLEILVAHFYMFSVKHLGRPFISQVWTQTWIHLVIPSLCNPIRLNNKKCLMIIPRKWRGWKWQGVDWREKGSMWWPFPCGCHYRFRMGHPSNLACLQRKLPRGACWWASWELGADHPSSPGWPQGRATGLTLGTWRLLSLPGKAGHYPCLGWPNAGGLGGSQPTRIIGRGEQLPSLLSEGH